MIIGIGILVLGILALMGMVPKILLDCAVIGGVALMATTDEIGRLNQVSLEASNAQFG